MDQNIEESLSLEGSMGVDFEHSGDIVIQGDIGLQESSQEIPMDFETTEGQTILMETENEEVIVSDFIDDPLTLSEYTLSEHSNDMATLNPTSSSLSSQSDTIVDLQYQQATLTAIKSETQPRIVTLKNLSSLTPITKKADSGVLKTVPRQVAIAPKPNYPVLAAKMNQKVHKSMGHVPIAPKPMISNKPVTFVTSKNPIGGTLKKVSIAGVVQAANKGNSVLAQIGKQLIMVPSGGQKIKLVSSNSLGGVQYVTGDKQQNIMTKKSIDGQNKQILPKLITVQGQQDDSQPVVITKLMSEGAGKLSQARFVTVQQKTAPSQLTQHLANKVLLKSPVKAVPAGTKKHEIIAIHAPTPIAPALTPVSGSSGVPENKVPIPANLKKVVVKPVSSQNFAQIAKKANVSEGSHTQLHQINVPGKGVQYIRLITNPGSAKPVAVKAQAAASAAPAKTFVLTDSKGNLIHMTADKMSSQPPPSLIITNNAPPKLAKIPQKLVRIAPIPPKTSQAATPRPAQSLLAPMSAEVPVAKQEVTVEHLEEAQMEEIEVQFESKESLQRMIEEATVDVENDATMSTEQESADDADDGDGMEGGDGAGDAGDRSGELEGDLERDLIVIPAFDNSEYMLHDKYKQSEQRDLVTVNVQCEREELLPAYTPPPPQLPDELIMRPRKACNCTKSQCLKLYCDCFANGEFCNQCNCNNCHNNLENEELRQKAIRGCLDRNPHAFRPKIGKTKSGGPEIVRRHNKGCNCKRSGCLKNYCECYEAKIACTYMCKCVGCRNVEETLERGRHPARNRRSAPRLPLQPLAAALDKQPCTLMTDEVIDAVCQCLLAVASEGAAAAGGARPEADPVSDVIDEFARCLRDVISAAHHAPAPATPEGAA